MNDPQAMSSLDEPTHNHDDLQIANELERLERKPPLYRFFRGTLYSLYGLVAAWVVCSIAWSAYQSVWGKSGQALKQQQSTPSAVKATPLPPPTKAP